MNYSEEIMNRKEALRPELEIYLETGPHFDMLRHPLVFGVPYHEELNAFYNEQLSRKTETVERALLDKKFHKYVFFHERPYRIGAFENIRGSVSDAEYWKLLHDIWVDSENIYQNRETWRDLLSSNRPGREEFMTEDDRLELDSMPDELVVYRGYKTVRDGMSWTDDEEIAYWFSSRYGSGKIAKRVVKKKDVFAFLSSRGEREIILL